MEVSESGGVTAQESLIGKARVNLERAEVLLIDNQLGLDVLSHIFLGFGARKLYRCRTAAEAEQIVNTHQLDLIVIEALLEGGEDGYDFVHALRRRPHHDANRFAPVLMLSAHTAADKVAKSRDCGANFFMAKPVSPKVVMGRLLWVAREKRQFLQSETYTGPDRRFHDDDDEAPSDRKGRRQSDKWQDLESLEKSA